MLKLYHHPRSTYARRVVIALAEKKIAYTPVILDMAVRENRAPAYLALNPYGRVPTVDDDGFILYESAAILRYLEDTRPQNPLLPADARQRALVDMHLRLCDVQMARPSGVIVFPKRFLKPERWDLTAIATAKAEIERHLGILENQLADQDYLVGNQFSLADIAYVPFLYFLPLMEITPPPAIARWSAHLLARPSALASVPDV